MKPKTPDTRQAKIKQQQDLPLNSKPLNSTLTKASLSGENQSSVNKASPNESNDSPSNTRPSKTKPPKVSPPKASPPKAKQLWASLYLPSLQLDSINPDQDTPIAITARIKNRQQVISCTKGAIDIGITYSMALNGAYALCPALTVIEYDQEYQTTLLRQVGEWAMQFSSIVSLHPPDHLLIEIAGSKRLFEGFETLTSLIEQELTKLGFTAQMGIAPTPLAANLLARANSRIGITRLERLPVGLKEFSVSLLDLDEQTIEGLRKSGIHFIGGLLNVSPASLTRRFGPACVKYLDCLMGKHPYPVKPLRSSEFFERSLDLPIEVHDTNALQFATLRMTNELSAFLIARDAGVNGYLFTLRHERHANTTLQLRFLQATSQPKHLHQVLTERLAQTTLPAPVSGLAMVAKEFSEIERNAADFFHKSQRQQKSLGEVIDKICSRLGADSLHALSTVDDHRPEKAWKKTFPDCFEHSIDHWPQRPLWMLDTPKIAKHPLQRISDIERIETGWWDDTDVRRDYFIAQDKNSTRYWVFKERDGSEHIYIHGLFA